MDINVTINVFSEDSLAVKIGVAAVDGALILILFIATALNLLVLAALLTVSSELVGSVRVILINILAACVIGDLGSVVYHFSAVVMLSGASISAQPNPVCFTVTALDVASNSGRVLFDAYYALTVFIVVRWWNEPVLAPRNIKYFIIGAVFVWILATVSIVPPIVYEKFSNFCGHSRNDSQGVDVILILDVAVPYFFFSAIPIIVTPILLIVIVCYFKRNTIRERRDTKKALVKFGFFLLLIQGFNATAQVVSPLLVLIGIYSQKDTSIATLIAISISDLSRVSTNLLIIAFFDSVRDKLKKWICYCNCCSCFKQIK